MQEQMDTSHRTSKKVDAPIIILFIKEKTEQTSSGNVESSKT